MPKGESMNLNKQIVAKVLENFEILSIDEYGYPDFDYEHRASKVGLAWWDIRLKRKSDGKTINLLIMKHTPLMRG